MPRAFIARSRNILQACRHPLIRIDPRIRNYRPPSWPRARPPQAIAIVGGGISGLAAAWLLKSLGHSVCVFEAQDRLGGRIRTEKLGPHVVEVGAGRFSDSHLRAIDWIKRFGLELEPMYPNKGRLVKLEHSGRRIGRDARVLSNHYVHSFVSHPDTWPRQFASPVVLASRFALDSLLKPSWYRIKGGNDQLPKTIARELANDINIESPIRKIAQTEDGVEVVYEINGIEQTRNFNRCVLTVPLTTLSDIGFSPQLSESKRAQVSERKSQPAIRLFALIRDRSALERDELCGYGCTDDGFEIWQPSFSSDSTPMALVAYAQGNAAGSLVAADDASRRQFALHLFEQMFPGVQDNTIETMSYSWVSDPWARGAQTLIDSGDVDTRRALANPEGRLHFAGEHTTGGWIDDALASAERVVSEISELQSS